MFIQEDSTTEFDDSNICLIEAACPEGMPIIEAYDGESFVFSDGIFQSTPYNLPLTPTRPALADFSVLSL